MRLRGLVVGWRQRQHQALGPRFASDGCQAGGRWRADQGRFDRWIVSSMVGASAGALSCPVPRSVGTVLGQAGTGR